jgi:hypothetical protein
MPSFVADDAEQSWISVFPQMGDQDPHGLCPIVAKISETLRRPAIAFIVHDSDVFCYWLFDDGRELDHYNSAPGYFDGTSLTPEGGDVGILGRYCVPGTSREQLEQLLRRKNPPTGKLGAAKDAKAVLLEKLRAEYPKMLARKPDLPGLEEMLAQAEQHLADLTMPNGHRASTGKAFVLAEDVANAPAGHLGIPDRRAISSYRYLEAGDGTMDSVLRVESDGVKEVQLSNRF